MKTVAAASALLTLLFAVQPVRAQDSGSTAAPEVTDAERAALLDQADATLDAVELLRALEAPAPMQRFVLDREALMTELLALVDRELPPSSRYAQDRLAYALGLVDRPGAWIDETLRMLETEVAGFYDHHHATFYILADTPAEMQGAIMAHELHHGVQDQNFDLGAMLSRAKWVTDVAVARQALVEGDAVAVMVAYSAGGAGIVTSPSPARAALSSQMDAGADANPGAPPVMWDQLLFPYVEGLRFVFALMTDGSWDPVDAAFADPPMSSEQVLHPERYLERDAPTWLTFDVASVVAALGGTRYLADVGGEMLLGSFCTHVLAERVSEAACSRAAEGWDGDRIEAFEFADAPDRDLLVWASVWDSADDARGFATTLARLSSPWLGTMDREEFEGAHGGGWLAASERGALWVEHWGDLALIVYDRNPESDADAGRAVVRAVADAVWPTVIRSEYPAF